jgi:arylsulfatase A-like enzyme
VMKQSRSLVLITVDCLRADHVGFMGYGRATTPFLDRLAKESFVFPTAIASGAPTFYSLPGIMASRHALSLGRDVIGLAPNEPTLASVLRDGGFATAAFVAANPYLSKCFGYDEGFDVFRDFGNEVAGTLGVEGFASGTRSASRLNRKLYKFSRKCSPLSAAYDELYFEYCQRIASRKAESMDSLRRFPSSDLLVHQALSWIESRGDQPFFLWLHFMDPHSPYYPTPDALRAMCEEQLTPSRSRYVNACWNRGELPASRLQSYRSEIVTLYDAGIRWVDRNIERLAQRLQEVGLWDRCALAFTADHGEEFLDHGGRFHPPANLKEEIIHVPLLLRVPGAHKSRVSPSPFSHVHLAPTLMEAIGESVPATFQGRSLWPNLLHESNWKDVAVVESVGKCTNPYDVQSRMQGRMLAIREKRYKLIVNFDSGVEELFDLLADPHELHPLDPHGNPDVRSRLLQSARQHVSRPLPLEHSLLRLTGRVHDLRLELAQLAG